MNLKYFRNNQKGLTLVEVVAAAAIMSIAFVALISLFTVSTATVGQTGENTQMMLIAQDLMEHSTGIEGYHELARTGGDIIPAEWMDKMQETYDGRYQASRTVERLSDHLIKITVRIYEPEGADAGNEAVLVTLLSSYR